MAAIDKVYVNSYEQADQFRTWCKAHTISDKYGVVKPLSYWVFKNINEWDDWSTAHPIFSAPNPVDYYVIRNCPFDFVQKSMKVNYDSAYDKIKNAEMYYTDNIGTINFETYQYLPDYTPGMHFSIKRVKGILHCNGVPVKSNRPYHTRQFTKLVWILRQETSGIRLIIIRMTNSQLKFISLTGVLKSLKIK